MSLRTRSYSCLIPILLTFSLMLSTMASFNVQTVTAEAKDNQVTVANYELIGTTSIPIIVLAVKLVSSN